MKINITIILVVLLFQFNVITAQQTLNETMLIGGITREYILYIPAGYDGLTPVPLLFNFHGATMSAYDQMIYCDMRPVADTADFVLVHPQGTLFNGETHWNVGSWTAGSTADDVGFTEAMIDTLAANYNIDRNKVYSCGFSNGGYLSFELACQLSNQIAAIGSVGGRMSTDTYSSCNPSHPTPVITIHGTADSTVSYYEDYPPGSKSVLKVIDYWVNFNNTDALAIVTNIPDLNSSDGSTVEFHAYNNGDNCTAVEHYKIIGGDHEWPGIWGNMDIHASRKIWEFLSKYDINGLIGCGTTSINKEINEIHIYPNPANDHVTIEMDLTENLEYYIYSSIGELIMSGIIDSNKITVDISYLSSNIYLLKVGNKHLKLIKTD